MKVAVMTDSNSGITQDEAKKLGVFVVPMPFTIDGKEYEEDRNRVANSNLEDHYTCTDIESMEEIAKKVPLSRIIRPQWDILTLNKLGVTSVNVDLDIWKSLWSEEEKANYASTPMFLVKTIK